MTEEERERYDPLGCAWVNISEEETNKRQATTGLHYDSWLNQCPCLGMRMVTGHKPHTHTYMLIQTTFAVWPQYTLMHSPESNIAIAVLQKRQTKGKVNNGGRAFGHGQAKKKKISERESERAEDERLKSGQQNKLFQKHLSDVSHR